jgi:arabinose-5-phosphate isomerase
MKNLDVLSCAKSVLQIERKALEEAEKSLGNDFIKSIELLRKLSNSGRLVVLGMGKSGHVGRKIAATLSSTGTPALFVHPAEAGHGDLGMITENDAVLAISQSGKSDELLSLVPYFKRNDIPMIVMSGNLESPLAKHAYAVINTAVLQEACPLGLAPTASTTLTLALGDALAICLLVAKGFTVEQFAATHPQGALGRKLLVKVCDVMVKDTEVPIILCGSSIRKAISEMSRASLGFVNIINKKNYLIGVFTDGDLRRTLDLDIDISTSPIDMVMKKNFISAQPDQLVVDVVDLMEKNKISSIPVLDYEEKIVGALNMRMILRSGAI